MSNIFFEISNFQVKEADALDDINLNPIKNTIIGFIENIKNIIKDIDYKSFANSIKDTGNRVINATKEIVKESFESALIDEDRKINGILILLFEEIKLLKLFKPTNINMMLIPNTTFNKSISET